MLTARTYRCLAIVLILGLFVPIAEAAGLGLTMHQIDVSQFPKIRAFVSVTNEEGVRIADLENDPQAFELLEDDKPVTGFQVEPIVASQEPVAVALVIDVSGSMNDEAKIDAAKQAASALIDTMGNRDGAAVISFSKEVKVVQPYTADKAALKGAIGGLKADGATLLYDAIGESAQLISGVQEQRKVILLLTDGENELPVGLPAKNLTLDAAIAAARTAKAPVYAVGLGSGVKKEVLDKLGLQTGGQAIYVAKADQLRRAFLNLGDQLRRQYVFQYTSKLPGDDKQHTLTVKGKYRGQTGEAKGTFTAKRTPLGVEVKGIANAAQLSGTRNVEVTVTGGTAKEVELLVDDQSRGRASAAPFVIPWDTTQEKPGIHRVVVRVSDAAGATTDKEFTVGVLPVAVPTAVPTAAPSPVATAPAKAAPAAPAETNALLYAIAGLAALLIAGGVVAFLVLKGRKPTIALPAPKPAPMSDRTEDMGLPVAPSPAVPAPAARATAPVLAAAVAAPPAAPPPPARPAADAVGGTMARGGVGETLGSGGIGATIVGGQAAPPMPRARVRIANQGSEHEVLITQAETMLGREEGNPIVVKDPMASRKHARIVVENGDFWVEDLKSLNGTLVNGRLITKQKLATNDQIKIGAAVLTFRIEQG